MKYGNIPECFANIDDNRHLAHLESFHKMKSIERKTNQLRFICFSPQKVFLLENKLPYNYP